MRAAAFALLTLIASSACGGNDPQPQADAGTTLGSDAGVAASGDASADAASAPDASAPLGSGTSAYFPAGSWFLEDVSAASKGASSDTAIKALRARGGFGNGDTFQIDFSIDVLPAEPTTPKRE